MSGANRLSATQIRDAIASNTLTCETVARDCLERIGAREADLHAFAYINPD